MLHDGDSRSNMRNFIISDVGFGTQRKLSAEKPPVIPRLIRAMWRTWLKLSKLSAHPTALPLGLCFENAIDTLATTLFSPNSHLNLGASRL